MQLRSGKIIGRVTAISIPTLNNKSADELFREFFSQLKIMVDRHNHTQNNTTLNVYALVKEKIPNITYAHLSKKNKRNMEKLTSTWIRHANDIKQSLLDDVYICLFMDDVILVITAYINDIAKYKQQRINVRVTYLCALLHIGCLHSKHLPKYAEPAPSNQTKVLSIPELHRNICLYL